jgi:hypothetical protein
MSSNQVPRGSVLAGIAAIGASIVAWPVARAAEAASPTQPAPSPLEAFLISTAPAGVFDRAQP